MRVLMTPFSTYMTSVVGTNFGAGGDIVSWRLNLLEARWIRDRADLRLLFELTTLIPPVGDARTDGGKT
jgi:hypothetical protein